MAKPSVYKSLSDRPYSTRVLELSPARSENKRLQGRLIEIDLALPARQRSKYEALSYVWGSTAGSSVISCDGHNIPITRNCELALRRFRYKYTPRILWVDAICINQKDMEERSRVVNMMDKVYRDAHLVQVWLGCPAKKSFGLKVFQMDIYCTRWIIKPIWGSPSILQAFLRIISAIVLFPIMMVVQLSSMNDELAHMANSEWFERIWTIQELALAKKAIVNYGPISCSWKSFSEAILKEFAALVFTFKSDDEKDQRYTVLCALREYLHAQLNTEKQEAQPDQAIDFVVSALRYAEATNPKDKAFGIYGLLRTMKIDVPYPDYTKSFRHICMETMLAIHNARKTLNFRHFWHPSGENVDWPTWLPDWTSSKQLEFPRSLEPRQEGQANVANQFRASLGAPAFSAAGETDSQLVVHSIVLDTIAAVGTACHYDDTSTWPNEDALRALNSWRDLAEEASTTSDHQSTAAQRSTGMPNLMLVMFKDTPVSKTLNSNQHVYFDDEAFVRWLDNGGRGKIINLWRMPMKIPIKYNLDHDDMKRILVVWNRQKVFRTRQNRLGMAGLECQQGDVVALIAGCDLPLVLRPCGQTFNYVGPAYLPGAMLGEMWPSDSESQLQKITLV